MARVKKPELTEKQLRLVWKSVDEIEKYPQTFDMGDSGYDFIIRELPINRCGSTACFGGHIVNVAKHVLRSEESVLDVAAQLLGFEDCWHGAISNLFWQSHFNHKKIIPENARERVQYWLDTGK